MRRRASAAIRRLEPGGTDASARSRLRSGFGDLPLVGVLFRNKSESNDKTELLIFVTPKLLKEDITL